MLTKLLYNMLSHIIIKRRLLISIHMIPHRNKILELIRKEEIVTSSEVAKFLKVSWNTAESYLKELLIENKLRRKKKDGTTLWMRK